MFAVLRFVRHEPRRRYSDYTLAFLVMPTKFKLNYVCRFAVGETRTAEEVQ